MLQQGIIQPPTSPFCSSVVIVKKSDDSYRMAIDYRALNNVTVFNAEPSCAIEEDVHKFSGANFFTELDLRPIMKFLCQKELCL